MYYDKYPSSGQWRWRLIAANGKIIANSGEAYHNEADCDHAIALVKRKRDRTGAQASCVDLRREGLGNLVRDDRTRFFFASSRADEDLRDLRYGNRSLRVSQ